MAPEFGLISHSSQGYPGELPAQSLGNGLRNGSLAYPWRTMQTQNIPFGVSIPESHGQELENSLLDLFEPGVVGVEDLLGLFDVCAVLRRLIPGYVQERLEVFDGDSPVLGACGVYGLHLLLHFLADMSRKVLLLHPFSDLVHFVCLPGTLGPRTGSNGSLRLLRVHEVFADLFFDFVDAFEVLGLGGEEGDEGLDFDLEVVELQEGQSVRHRQLHLRNIAVEHLVHTLVGIQLLLANIGLSWLHRAVVVAPELLLELVEEFLLGDCCFGLLRNLVGENLNIGQKMALLLDGAEDSEAGEGDAHDGQPTHPDLVVNHVVGETLFMDFHQGAILGDAVLVDAFDLGQSTLQLRHKSDQVVILLR